MRRLPAIVLVGVAAMALTSCTVPLPEWTSIASDGSISYSPCADIEIQEVVVEYGSFDEEWALIFEPPVIFEFDSQQVAEGDVLKLDHHLLGDAASRLRPVSEWDAVRVTYADGWVIELEDVDEGEWVRDPGEGLFQTECAEPSA